MTKSQTVVRKYEGYGTRGGCPTCHAPPERIKQSDNGHVCTACWCKLL